MVSWSDQPMPSASIRSAAAVLSSSSLVIGLCLPVDSLDCLSLSRLVAITQEHHTLSLHSNIRNAEKVGVILRMLPPIPMIVKADMPRSDGQNPIIRVDPVL